MISSSNQVFSYMDDLLLFSPGKKSVLSNHNWRLSLDKCQWEKKRLDSIRFSPTHDGLKPTECTLSNLEQLAIPMIMHQWLSVQSWLLDYVKRIYQGQFILQWFSRAGSTQLSSDGVNFSMLFHVI